MTSNLCLSGVSRAADDGEPLSRRVIELHFNREPTDDEMRAVHEHMRLAVCFSCDRVAALDCSRGTASEVCKCKCHPENKANP